MFHRPGFGLLVSVPRSLSTQPPLATQALIVVKYGACWNVGWSFSYSAACSMNVVWFLCTIFCHWVNLFACSFNARLVWRERTGQSMKSHMLVDEIGNPKASV